ncbi:MAG: HEAT repeat domain-containing protein [Nitrospirae bacterium]|nr:HEAT repeat domain-containing protein [Nitrospirota bacterium]
MLRTSRKTVKLFPIVLSCIIFFLMLSGLSGAVEYDGLISEFQKDDWERALLNDRGIQKFQDEKLFNDLVRLINNRGLDWSVRIRGIKLLGEIKTAKAVANLVDMFNDPFFNHECPSIKSYVAAALGNFSNDPAVVDALISGLNDGELLVREASIQSLGRIGNHRAVPHLITVLNDKSFAVKASAINALQKIGDQRAVPYLKTLADTTDDRHLKEVAQLALKRFSSGNR